MFIVKNTCSVTNTKWNPNNISLPYKKMKMGYYKFTMLQILSLTKWFFIQT